MNGRALVALCLVLGMTGCGVPMTDRAEPISGARRPSTSSPTASVTAGTSTGAATVWFVDNGRLVPRAVPAPSPVTSASALGLLGAVPAGADGLVTLIADPLGGAALASIPAPASAGPSSPSSSPAVQVELSPTFNELTGQEQVLLIGQVVLTLTEIDPAPVSFVDAALAPLSVPLPDGRLRDGPVTRGDYISLT